MSANQLDFSIDAMRHLDSLLQQLRSAVLSRTDCLASEENVSVVTRDHVDHAWEKEMAVNAAGRGV